MGANSSSRLEDEEVITVVKGIRLTDRVINRMKESSKAANQSPQSNNQTHPPVNLGKPWSPAEHLVPILPHRPSYASSLVTPPLQVPVPFASVTQEIPAPPPPADPSTVPTVEAVLSSPSSQENAATSLHTESLRENASASDAVVTSLSTAIEQSMSVVTPSSSHDEAIVPPATTESTAVPVEPFLTNTLAEEVAASETPPSPDAPFTVPAPTMEEPVPIPSPPVTAEPIEDLAPPQSTSALALPSELPFLGQRGSTPTEEASPTSSHLAEPDVPSMLPLLNETQTSSTPQAVVNEEELRKQIRDELQKHLEEEMKTAKLKIQQQLEEEKAKVEAEARAKAQLQIQAEVQKVLEKEQHALQQSLKDAIMQERMNTEDERLVAQYYWMERKIQKVEEKENQLAKQDILYRQQITKLEEKTAQFTRVTAESFRKGLEDTHNRFKRSHIKPVCSELQSEILKCYLMNTGKTLTCSNIASLYIQCVDNAKQNKKVSTGG